MTDTFTPTIYVRQGCPFCLKLRLFLLESGQLSSVVVREGQTEEEHRQLADHLTDRLGKASFPSAEIMPGSYLADSDALVEHFGKTAGANPAALPTYQAYVGHVMPHLLQLFQENTELKKQLDASGDGRGAASTA